MCHTRQTTQAHVVAESDEQLVQLQHKKHSAHNLVQLIRLQQQGDAVDHELQDRVGEALVGRWKKFCKLLK